MDAVKPAFTLVNGRAVGTLRVGLNIDGERRLSFQLREYDLADMMDAEQEASAMNPITFNAQLLVRQLVSLGDYTGPFSINMLRQLKPVDWRILRAAQGALEELGEAEPGATPPG